MSLLDTFRYAWYALSSNPLRTLLSTSGIAIGIAAVILLTAIGEGIQQFVLAEFTQFGTHILNINPGKTGTRGTPAGAISSARPLTIEDSLALKTSQYAVYTNATVTGNAEVRANGHSRRVTVYGQGPDFDKAFNMQIAIGEFLPEDDPRTPRAFAVLGAKVHEELYGTINPLGSVLQVGGARFRVIGVMAPKGQVLGFDLDDTVYIPTARALEVFNRDGVMEIQVVYLPDVKLDNVISDIRQILIKRHGREDFTLTPQQQMLSTLSTVLNVLTFAVAALGGISLLVGAVGMITLMHIAVTERVAEIGLLNALGAPPMRIRLIFLLESTLLATVGGAIGLSFGTLLASLIKWLVSSLPVTIHWQYVLIALTLSGFIGLTAGIIPAIRAARLDPVDALRKE